MRADYLCNPKQIQLYSIHSRYFFAIGINYKKTDASKRGIFSINHEQYDLLIQSAHQFGIDEFFVLSTCNRTEIYGLANNANTLIDLLCSQTAGQKETFIEYAYIKKDIEAIKHVFSVAAGLDSQILGDYEIVGQLKTAIKFSKDRNHIGPFIERLINTVLQSSKSIKNQTELSSGTVSVSFAAIQFIKNNVTDIHTKKIALIGTGKIGTNTCKNLIDYLGAKHITLLNRTDETAESLATTMNVFHAPFSALKKVVNDADIIIVSTNASEPIISKSDIFSDSQKIMIDLSIPNNINPDTSTLDNVMLANVDDLSKINDDNLYKRQNEIPKALAIIDSHTSDFLDWLQARRFAPAIKAVKEKLNEISANKLFPIEYNYSEKEDTQKIEKIVKNTAVKMRIDQQVGCSYIEAINEYIIENSKN